MTDRQTPDVDREGICMPITPRAGSMPMSLPSADLAARPQEHREAASDDEKGPGPIEREPAILIEEHDHADDQQPETGIRPAADPSPPPPEAVHHDHGAARGEQLAQPQRNEQDGPHPRERRMPAPAHVPP